MVKSPDYSFLISNGNRHILFDLGMRHDRENLPPKTVSLIKNTTNVDIGANVADVLDSDVSGLNIRSKDIEAIVWSHHHFDHTGDPSTFSTSTTLVVGPGVKNAAWPGYPTNSNGTVLDSDIAGRDVREISFNKDAAETVRFGPFDAHDYFGDGSFYLLDAPGHSIGHLCGLSRVTTDPDTFVFMGGDCCHHAGVLRPSRHLPLPFSEFSEDISFCAETDVMKSSTKTDAFFRVAPTLTSDHGQALETVEKIKVLEGSGKVFVILAHDATLKDQIDFYPKKINDWKRKGDDSRTRWLFCNDLKEAKIV